MTDNEIIEALECCVNNITCSEECPYYVFDKCLGLRRKDVIDLINRKRAESNKYRNKAQNQRKHIMQLMKKNEEQKAEIERLKGSVITNNVVKISKIRKTAKSEVIKEFAERLKRRIYPSDGRKSSRRFEVVGILARQKNRNGADIEAN